MKKNTTELVFILDRSGSMSGLEADTVGGYNSMLEKQKKSGGDVIVTTVLFDSEVETLHDRIDLKKLEPITEKEYFVRGCTALLDAVGSTINRISALQKADKANMPEKTLFVITTDGMENSSHEYNYSKVKKMIEKKKKKGWEFLFLGANIDAVEVAGRFGIGANRAVKYKSDSAGTKLNYDVLAKAVCAFRENKAPLADSWKEEIEADCEARS